MNFSWTKEQETLYQHILTETQHRLDVDTLATDYHWGREQWQVCAELGLLGLSVPEIYGGRGYNASTTALAIEAFGKGCKDTGLVFSAAAHLLACSMPLVEYGSDEMKEAWLPGLCSGLYVGANAITEKQAGSDLMGLKSRVVRDGDHYILYGTKSYVSNGPLANLFMVYAFTNPAHGYLGISAFLVPRELPGLHTGKAFDKMGLTSTPACEVYFDDCRIPLANRVGQEGEGALIFKRSMQWERACLFALYLGQMDRQLEQSIRYASERHQSNSPLAKKQAIAHRLANMRLRLESSRLLLYRACWQLDQGQNAMLAIALSKLAVSEAAIQGGLDAIQIHGSVGFDRQAGIEQMLRDAIPGTIFSGTSEIQRDIIASELGL